MSVDDFMTKVLASDNPLSLEEYYKEKGEQNITATQWQPMENEVYDGHKVLEQRTIDLRV